MNQIDTKEVLLVFMQTSCFGKKITMNSFDQLYYINLEYRKDMYDSINNVIENLQFDKIKVTRINAIKKDNGAYGVALSHIQALEDAKKHNYNKILIFEDYFKPFNYGETKYKVSKFLNDVQDWDLLLLSSISPNYEECDIDNVKKSIDSQCCIAYAVNENCIDNLLQVFKESAKELSVIKEYNLDEPCPYCIDVNWKKIQKEKKVYAFVPILGREYSKFSEIQKRFLNHFSNTYYMIRTYKDLKNYHFENDNEIPKIIFRTGKFKVHELPSQIIDIYNDEISNNPEYTLYYFDDYDCQIFMERLGDERLLNAYNKLIPTAYKADLWRYSILRKYGGIYIDFAHRSLYKYDEIIKDYNEIYVRNYPESHGIYNAFICTYPNSRILNKVIELSIENVEKERYGDSFMDIVSCNTLRKAYNIINNKPEDSEIELGSNIKYWQINHIYDSNDNMIIKSKDFNDYYSIIYGTDKIQKDYPPTHYKNLWNDKLIFKDEKWFDIENHYKKIFFKTPSLHDIISYYKIDGNIHHAKQRILLDLNMINNENSLLNNIPIYVVNLKERIELTERLKKTLEYFGVLDKTFFLNTTTFDLLPHSEREFWDNICSDRLNYSSLQLSVGCLSSNFRIWEKIRDSENDYGLVFEEDVLFKENFLNEFNNIQIPEDFDILFIGGNFLQFKDFNAEVKELSILDKGVYIPDFKNKDCFTTEGYILSKKGAKKLIDYINIGNTVYEDNLIKESVKSFSSIDWYIHNLAKKGLLSYYGLNPLICYQN